MLPVYTVLDFTESSCKDMFKDFDTLTYWSSIGSSLTVQAWCSKTPPNKYFCCSTDVLTVPWKMHMINVGEGEAFPAAASLVNGTNA